MDVRAYYQKIRKMEAELPERFVVVVSQETADGGKPGVMTEVPRGLAAKLIVEGQAALASSEQTEQFRAETEKRRREAAGEEGPASAAERTGRSARPQGKRQ